MTELPAHLRRTVEAIEREPGEADLSAADIEGRTAWLLEGADDDIPGSAEVEEAVRTILRGVGEDPDRQGLDRTPARVRRMYAELTAGR